MSRRLSNRKSLNKGNIHKSVSQVKFYQPRLNIPPTAYVSEDELQSIHDKSIEILEKIGIQCTNENALEFFKKAGAEIDYNTQIVKINREMVFNAIASSPSSFTIHSRNPDKNLIMGDGYISFSSVGSAPNSSDLDNGKRPGNHEDYKNFLRLSQSLNIIHMVGGYPVEPINIPPSIRHLECTSDLIKLTDKVYSCYSLGAHMNQDVIEMTRIARGITQEQISNEPSLFTIINSNSPLKLDTPMLQGIIEMSKHNQVVILTPFTLAGAMAPVTLSGALAQQNAEALIGLVLTQLVRKGSPFIYGGFTSNVDMKSGAPAFGTPEYMKAAIVSGQLARKYNVPFRSSNTCAANYVDAQSAYESVFSLWGSVMGGVNFLMHGAGWMEGGLTASFEKMVLDADLLQMIAKFLEPINFSEDEFGLNAISEVGPGGHYFGSNHTRQRYQSAFYAPILSDWRNYQSWVEAGSPKTHEKANQIYKQLLNEYTQPPLDTSIEEELDEFVEKTKEKRKTQI